MRTGPYLTGFLQSAVQFCLHRRLLANLYSGNVYIWNINDSVRMLAMEFWDLFCSSVYILTQAVPDRPWSNPLRSQELQVSLHCIS